MNIEHVESRQEAERRLLPAEYAQPLCGVCCRETDCEGDYWVCRDCRLFYELPTLEARYFDEDKEPCGQACNSCHGYASLLPPGWGRECRTCALPAGHTSAHWHGCRFVLPEAEE